MIHRVDRAVHLGENTMCSQIVQICDVVVGFDDRDYGVTGTDNWGPIPPQGE